MARQIARLLALSIVFVVILGVRSKHVTRRSLDNIKCHVNSRFYRNPDRTEESTWNSDECAKYYLCLDGDVFEFHCSQDLLFDVNRQLCDKRQNVHNCDLTTEALVSKPLLDMAKCANDTHLGCADGNCLPAEYFCDGSLDCDDSSDEGWCDVHYDPNAAERCDPKMCQLPDCFCSKNGTETPGNLVPSQTPQMITLTIDGPVNHENWDAYTNHIFTTDKRNPNGCPIKATFFVSHLYTNYRHVQKLWNDGHEIAVNSITLRGPEEWWSKNATVEDWFDEMVGQANVINRFGRVRMEDFRGMRVPYLSVGWNRQFLMMQEFGFVYDASVVAPYASPPYWPYTLDYKMPHRCTGNNQYCPTRSYAGLWEMVINPLMHNNHVCATLEYCPTNFTRDDVYNVLLNNFKRHYLKNRAPFGIHLNAEWLKNSDYLQAIKRFINELLKLPDVYFNTYREVIDWIRRPTPVLQLKKFEPWQCKNRRFEEHEIACAKPNTCKLPSKVLQHDKYMITCSSCPKSYPWLRNEFGFE
ncbi:chitin deacetylase 1 isoform X1 [Plodia interpunctella]|uniref:chitin deacetylase 1 isoform X1 n=1 Tax=Plodia interpunctella TaxID=58824 RepID=UPI0023680211|nr:chitin deacetylase 1 [Plodia interpunctella]